MMLCSCSSSKIKVVLVFLVLCVACAASLCALLLELFWRRSGADAAAVMVDSHSEVGAGLRRVASEGAALREGILRGGDLMVASTDMRLA